MSKGYCDVLDNIIDAKTMIEDTKIVKRAVKSQKKMDKMTGVLIPSMAELKALKEDDSIMLPGNIDLLKKKLMNGKGFPATKLKQLIQYYIEAGIIPSSSPAGVKVRSNGLRKEQCVNLLLKYYYKADLRA